MNKTSKTTLISLLTAVPTIANAMLVGGPKDFNLEIYGKLAMSVFATQANERNYDYTLDNESYIGFRGNKEITEGINVIFQIESGYVGYEAEDSGLGKFDTFVGFEGKYGKLRFGRMKSALYEIIDWPYTNPGLGRVFDWGGDVRWHQSNRMSNMMRYDGSLVTDDYGAFDVVLSVNRDDATISGSTTYSSRITWTPYSTIKVHAAYEETRNKSDQPTDDTLNNNLEDASGYVLGLEVPIPDLGLRFYAGYKNGQTTDLKTHVKSTQDAYSLIGEYWHGIYGAKLGYAKNNDYKIDNVVQKDTADKVISLQLMLNMENGFLPYIRVGRTDAYNSTSNDNFYRAGLEFWF
ncbi:TPA: porin [Enterobacter hormaechei]|nr:porin [Enterobacter hormaechei]